MESSKNTVLKDAVKNVKIEEDSASSKLVKKAETLKELNTFEESILIYGGLCIFKNTNCKLYRFKFSHLFTDYEYTFTLSNAPIFKTSAVYRITIPFGKNIMLPCIFIRYIYAMGLDERLCLKGISKFSDFKKDKFRLSFDDYRDKYYTKLFTIREVTNTESANRRRLEF